MLLTLDGIKQLSSGQHLFDYVQSPEQLPLGVHLRVRGPIAERLQSLSHRLISQNVKGLVRGAGRELNRDNN